MRKRPKFRQPAQVEPPRKHASTTRAAAKSRVRHDRRATRVTMVESLNALGSLGYIEPHEYTAPRADPLEHT